MPSAPGAAWEARRGHDRMNRRRCAVQAVRLRGRAASKSPVCRAPRGARRGTWSSTPSRSPETSVGSGWGARRGGRLPLSPAAGGLMGVQRVRLCRSLSLNEDRHPFRSQPRSPARREVPPHRSLASALGRAAHRPLGSASAPGPCGEGGTAGTGDGRRVPRLTRAIYVREGGVKRSSRIKNHFVTIQQWLGHLNRPETTV